MLQVSDVRQTRVFQEALEEGLREGMQKGREEGREEEREAIASELLEIGRPVDEIAKVTGLAVLRVRKLKKKKSAARKKGPS